jgi:hypothetical protein
MKVRKKERKKERFSDKIYSNYCADDVTPVLIAMKFGHLIEVFISGLQ